MDHKSNVGFIDTHTESVGGHHHSYLVILPSLLTLVFHDTIQSCMIEGGSDACLLNHVGHLFRATPAAGIHNSRTFQTTEDVDEFLLFVFSASDDIGQVLSFKTHAKDSLFGKRETLLNIVHDSRSCCGCQCQYWYPWQQLANLGNLKIRRAEVITPL